MLHEYTDIHPLSQWYLLFTATFLCIHCILKTLSSNHQEFPKWYPCSICLSGLCGNFILKCSYPGQVCDDFIFVPLSRFSAHYWNYNWLCWIMVPSIIKTHQSDKPVLDVKTKCIRYGLWATLVHSVGLHVNSVEGSCSCWLCCF